jgi:hypothetical protein
MILKNSVLKEIKKNRSCVRALEDLNGKAPFTMQTWLKINHPMLCNINSLKVICAYLKTDIDSITEHTESDFLVSEISKSVL